MFRVGDTMRRSARSGREAAEARAPREREPAKAAEPEPSEDAMELEKLFNKTAAQPPIYWKPLTADEVKVRHVTAAHVRVPTVSKRP
jgi:hypothetical protein